MIEAEWVWVNNGAKANIRQASLARLTLPSAGLHTTGSPAL
jgi:hypothetical protein